MRLRRLDLTRYGKFTDYSIDFGEHVDGAPDLHIVYGLNEAGKTTSLSAYLDTLFGIEERTKYGFLHQSKAMEVGACLEFDGGQHVLKRIKLRKNSLLNDRGQAVSDAILTAPLAGLTRDAYKMMFSLDDQTLEDGGNAILESKGDLGELLFSASSGLSGISSVLESAAVEADEIYRKRASSTKIATLKRQIADLKAQRESIDIQASAYKVLTTALEQANSAYQAVMKEIGGVKARNDELTRIGRVYPLVGEYQRAVAEIATYAHLPHPPAQWSALLPELLIEETTLAAERSSLEHREQNARVDLDGFVLEPFWDALEDRLDQLSEAAARNATAQEDLPKRKHAHSEVSRKVDQILAALARPDAEPKSLLLPAATIGILRDLISGKSGVDVTLVSSNKELDGATQLLEKERRDSALLVSDVVPVDAATLSQLQSVIRRLREGNTVAELAVVERAVPLKRQAFDDALAQLHPWHGDGDGLRRIVPPAADRIQSWQALNNEFEKRRSQAEERLRELQDEKAQVGARLSALRDAVDILDDEEAKASFAARDGAWTDHLAALARSTADVFETRMRATDAAMTARLVSARELEELRALNTQYSVNTESLNRQSALLGELERDLEAFRSEIRAETPLEIGLKETAPTGAWVSMIRSWHDVRAAALIAWDDLRRSTADLDRAKSALNSEQEALVSALARVGVQGQGLDLAALVQAADTLTVEHSGRAIKQAEIAKRIAELEDEVARRQIAQAAALEGANKWQADWSAALALTWFDADCQVGAARELLDAISGLPAVLRESDDLLYRISAMERDATAFVESVSQLYADIGESLGDRAPHGAAKDLLRRRDDAKNREAKRQERKQILEGLLREWEMLDHRLALHSARVKELTEFFREENLSNVRLVLDRCLKRDALVEQTRKLEQQIVAELNAQSIEAAIVSLETYDVKELNVEQAELATILEALDGRSKDLFADKARAMDRLNAIGGDHAAAALEAKRRTLLLETEELALRYLRLRSGTLIAEQGIRAYRDKHRSAMMQRASEAFRLITRNEYQGLTTRTEKDRETLIGLTHQGGSKFANEMSKGTQFQLYLALRLAGYEEFAKARPSVPFIADDIMETFDEPRSQEVFRLFGQMANVGQVIYLTHHRHLCEIAAQVVPTVKIHDISAR